MDFNKLNKIYFIGIGGIGVSALARICKSRGLNVSGSDSKESELTKELINEGIVINYNHKSENITNDIDLVVKTSAVKENDETLKAKELNIPVVLRGTFLSFIANQYNLIGISGSHGKTTTTALTTFIFKQFYNDTSFNIGGILKNYNSNSQINNGKYFVTETDESDGSFLELFPKTAVLNNLDYEHIEHYGTFENLKKAFVQFANQSEIVIWNKDDEILNKLSPEFKKENYSFGIKNADFVIKDIEAIEFGTKFKLEYKDNLFSFNIPLQGFHNVYNATASLISAYLAKIDLNKIDFSTFAGTKRRFELVYSHNKINIYDDYAHHPNEIKAFFNTALQKPKRTIIIFQPHRYTRTRDNFNEFVNVLKMPKNLIVLKEYAASEEILQNCGAIDIFNKLKKDDYNMLKFVNSVEEATEFLLNNLRDYDNICCVGAGSVNQIAYKLKDEIESLKSNLNSFKSENCEIKILEGINNKTTYKIGGLAKLLVYPLNKNGLIDILKNSPFPIKAIGNGSNMLVKDGILNYTFISLEKYNSQIKQENEYIFVPAKTLLRDMASFCLETCKDVAQFYLIPGTLGGGLFTNAGAFKHFLGDYIEEIEVIDENFNYKILKKDDLKIEYRKISGIENKIILGAKFKFIQGDFKEENKKLLEEYKAYRLERQPQGFPNCGSVFKNPKDNYSGKLIEELDLKGKKIGGARVSLKHGNFIENFDNASFQNVFDLICSVKEQVFEKYNILLEEEVRIIK